MAKKPYETQAFRMRNGKKLAERKLFACKMAIKPYEMQAFRMQNRPKSFFHGSSALAGWLASQRALCFGGSGLMEPSPAKNLKSEKWLEVFFYFLSQGWPGQGVPTYPGQNQTLPPLPPLPECFNHICKVDRA